MNKFLFSIILFLIPLVGLSASNIPNVDFRVNNGQVFGSRNLVKNPNCRLNAANITAASVSMTANTTSAPLDGISDCRWNPTATAQEISWAVDTMPTGIKNGNCEARLNYSGDASLVSFFMRNSSGIVATGISLTNADNSQATASINYPCSDGTAVPVLRSTGDAPNNHYSVYTGRATNLSNVAQASQYGTITWNPTTNCIWGTTSASWTNYSADSDCTIPTGSAITQFASAPATKIPAITFAQLPPGDYHITVTGTFRKNSAANESCYFRLHDGTNAAETNEFPGSVIFGNPNITGKFSYSTARSNVTIQVQARTNGTASCELINTDTTADQTVVFKVLRFPLNSELAITSRLPVLPTRQKIITGTNYTTPVGATLLHVKMCGAGGGGGGGGTSLSSGSAGTSTTFGSGLTAGGGGGGPAGVGSGGAGGTVTITGVADAISMPGSFGQAGTGIGSSTQYATGGSGGNSPLFSGGGGGAMAAAGNAGTANSGGGGAGGGALNAASVYAGTGGGSGGCLEALIKNPLTAYTISVGSGGNFGAAGPSGAAGARGADGVIDITEYYQGMNAPILIGSVTSLNQSSAIRHEAAAISCTSSSSVVRQTASSFISTIGNISAGACVITFGAAWAVAPICTISRDSSNDPDQFFAVNGATTTGITTDCDVSGGADCTSYGATVICTGIR